MTATHLGAAVRALFGVLIGLSLAACAQDVGDIDRTQPNKLQKSTLDGEWYLARTVIDAPYTTEFTFIGESAELERVRWDIQKDILVAYRVYDRVDGTDNAVQYSEAPYQGAPIVAYKILSHFDVVRQYNPATGEQSNVIVENITDRPWYERKYIRVDWSQNVLPSLTFLVNWSAGSLDSYTVTSPLSIHVEDPNDPLHMVVGQKNPDGAWTDYRDEAGISGLSRADYLEVTVRTAVEPAYIELDDWFGSVFRDPACWYYANADCEHQNIVVRHSFMKVPDRSSYQPMRFPDNALARDADGKPILGLRNLDGNVEADPEGVPIRFEYFDKFGFFRTERFGYDPVYGELESNRTYLLNRHNLLDPNGNPTPIIYYKSPDFPDWLNPAAAGIAEAYDAVFKKAVKALGMTPPEHMFELRDNTGQRIGDMRHSFLYYVPKPTLAGLLGYGPSAADPLTGEIISAAAYIYGAPLTQYAGAGQRIVDLINGHITAEDIGLGADLQVWLAQARAAKAAQGADKPGPKSGAVTPPFAALRPPLTQAQLEAFVARTVASPHGQAVRAAGKKHIRRKGPSFSDRLQAIRGTLIEDALITDEVKLLKGRNVIGPGDLVPPGAKSHLSPATWLSHTARDARRQRAKRYQRRSMYMAEFVDDAVSGLALSLADKGYKSAAALRQIEIAVARSTAEHELGHTLGLRHNFAGSYDAMNYPRRFWDLRGGSPAFPPTAETPEQISGRMDEARESSIMEYPARFNADWNGLGAYDIAALMFGYAQMVEVFDSPPLDPLADAFADTFDLRFALQDTRHYSSIPAVMGGVDALYARHFVPYSKLQAQLVGQAPWTDYEVPYRFCSDEYEGATSWCAAYDAGADPYEIVRDAASRYRNYYFFRAFKGDRAGWDGASYDWGLYERYFRHALNQYQHWAFLAFDATDQWELWREDPNYYGIEDTAWDLARDGGAPLAAAARESLSFLLEVLATPRPGAYLYDPDQARYWRWDSAPYPNVCDPSALEKDDPDLDCVDLNLPLGEGRYAFTQYDFEGGYYYYERPKWVGAFADKVMALDVLSDTTVNFLGVNTAEDVQAYALGFFLYFPDILSRVSGGIIADDINVWAGTTAAGVYTPPDPFRATIPAGQTIVDPDTWSTVQYYAMYLAMAGYAAGFDNSFNDLMHVWYDGSDGAQTGFDPADPRVASWTDPNTLRTWRAIADPDPKRYSPGYQMVRRAAELQARIDDPLSDPADAEYDTILLGYQRELLDLAIGMWDIYGRLTF